MGRTEPSSTGNQINAHFMDTTQTHRSVVNLSRSK
jgi:hypothetical protein